MGNSEVLQARARQETSTRIRAGVYAGARADATGAARGAQVYKGRGLAEADTEP